jgi:hypothetical protein
MNGRAHIPGLAPGKTAIDAERVRPAMESGRYIPDPDHCIPDGVPRGMHCHHAGSLLKLTGKR